MALVSLSRDSFLAFHVPSRPAMNVSAVNGKTLVAVDDHPSRRRRRRHRRRASYPEHDVLRFGTMTRRWAARQEDWVHLFLPSPTPNEVSNPRALRDLSLCLLSVCLSVSLSLSSTCLGRRTRICKPVPPFFPTFAFPSNVALRRCQRRRRQRCDYRCCCETAATPLLPRTS